MYTRILIQFTDGNTFEVHIPIVLDARAEVHRYLREGIGTQIAHGAEMFYPPHSILNIMTIKAAPAFNVLLLTPPPPSAEPEGRQEARNE